MSGLYREVPRLTQAISPESVIDAGVANLTTFTSSSTILLALKKAYAIAISRVIIYALVMACAAIPCACCMQWLNVKMIAEGRKEAAAKDKNTMELIATPVGLEESVASAEHGDLLAETQTHKIDSVLTNS